MKDQAKDRRSPIIAGAVALTAIFLGLFGWLLSRTDTCPAGFWLWDRLSCLEPNSLGDTFAGAFAPVAFVWLVAAVMLQRNELAAQRQELRESRLVATQQVEEARKNVGFIEAQTKLLEASRILEETKQNDDQFLEMIDIFNRSFRWCDGRFSAWEVKPTEGEMLKSMENLKLKFASEGDAIEQAKKNIDAITDLHFGVVFFSLKHDRFKHRGLEHFQRAADLLSALAEKTQKLSEPMRAKAIYMAVETGNREAQEILEVFDTQGATADWREIPSES